MKKKKKKPRRPPIEAAGGIVMRGRVRPLFAVVQLRRQKTWVLPKGKLNPNETALAAARREAIEETGHDMEVHEFLGSLVYKSAGRSKTVRFWRMQASRRPVAKLMRDVRAVRWLSLAQATARLTHERERVFLDKVGRQVIRQTGPSKRSTPKSAAKSSTKAAPSRRKKATAVPRRGTAATGGPAGRSVAVRGHARPEEAQATALVMQPVHIQATGRKPPAIVRKLWSLLRR
jgi:8-oxo-dGTP diphosphatase